jgi:DsbC/DsbD-like thiol-disulfide interchange protein/cytochrome c biogenesis protein CcdA
MIRFFFAFILAVMSASISAQIPGKPLNVPATLVAETAQPAPGQTVTLAFKMHPKPTWHGYWENPGDAGVGMQLDWQLPKGVTAGKLRYPVPGTLIISGLMNYVYEKPYTLLVDIKVDALVAQGTKLPIKVRGDWLACTDRICVPEGADLAIDLVVGDGVITAGSRAEFDSYRAALPVPLDQNARYAVHGKVIEIAIPYPANAPVTLPYFFALTPDIIDYPVAQSARRVGDMLIIKAGYYPGTASGVPDKAGYRKPASAAQLQPIAGVLRYGDGQGLIISAIPGTIPKGGIPVESGGNGGRGQGLDANGFDKPSDLGFGTVLLFSILGGLILNLMPCVFPILGLKALSIAKMGNDAGVAKRDALAYSAGVILSVMALGGILLTLRATGQAVGWAFQLQEPRIVIALLLLMVAVTVSLFGGYQFSAFGPFGNATNNLANRSGIIGSFWTGVLAAVVATPCTGPFMAAAMGAALVLSPLPALTIFAGLGLGLALPYLAIAYIPMLRALLPKPGPWLQKFRTAMAVPMAITAAALLWLLWRLSGSFGLLVGAGASLALIALLLALGYKQRRGVSGKLLAMTACLVAFAGIIALPNKPVAAESSVQRLLKVEAYSQARLDAYRATGTPVFVYFTADWCVTCKVNESAAIQRSTTAQAFSAAGIKVLEGDFTRRDPELLRVLTQYGRSGVPLYLYFPKSGKPQILPQILTPQMLLDLK